MSWRNEYLGNSDKVSPIGYGNLNPVNGKCLVRHAQEIDILRPRLLHHRAFSMKYFTKEWHGGGWNGYQLEQTRDAYFRRLQAIRVEFPKDVALLATDVILLYQFCFNMR